MHSFLHTPGPILIINDKWSVIKHMAFTKQNKIVWLFIPNTRTYHSLGYVCMKYYETKRTDDN